MTKHLYIENKQILASIKRVSADINSYFKVKEIDDIVILTVMNGGMLFASHLIPKIKAKAKLDYCQVSRYGNEQQGSIVNWKVFPQNDLEGKTVLILDDIYDEGYTLKAIQEYVWKQGGTPIIAVMLDKVRDDKTNLTVDFVGTIIPNKFVFGFGLDLEGYERNLPDIWYQE